jgi:hypothetical protein
MMRGTLRTVVGLAATILATLTGLATLWIVPASVPVAASQSGPTTCVFDGGHMASGDAGKTDGKVYVCTDGALVPAAGYGHAYAPATRSAVWWDHATCDAFAQFTMPGAFHAMVVNSRRASWPLRGDVADWAHALRIGAAHDVVINDVVNTAMDCHEIPS